MSYNLWDDDQSIVEMPEEANEGYVAPTLQIKYGAQAPPQQPKPAPKPSYKEPEPEQSEEDTSFMAEALFQDNDDDDDDFTEVLSDASLRLEQGTLYKMIMNHDIFAGIDADPRAVKNVQREIKKFAKERMEVMLGMRTEVAQVGPAVSVFNELEVDILKKLAYKATSGATQNYSTPSQPTPQPVAERRTSLNQISTKPKSSPQQITKTAKPLQSTPTKPVAKQSKPKTSTLIAQIAAEEGIPVELLEKEMGYTGTKPPSEMSEDELVERNRRASNRTQVKSTSALPMATSYQMDMMAQNAANQFSQSDFSANLIAKIKSMPPTK